MNIGKKFAITALVLSIVNLIVFPLFIYIGLTIDSDALIPLLVFIFIVVIGLFIASLVIGILMLCLVTEDKTKNRGLHIANGIILIIWLMLPVIFFIVTIIISSIIISNEKNDTTKEMKAVEKTTNEYR